MKIPIILNKIEDIKRFAEIVTSYEEQISLIKNGKTYDAKSILSIFAMMDSSSGLWVTIKPADDKTAIKFLDDMKEFEDGKIIEEYETKELHKDSI